VVRLGRYYLYQATASATFFAPIFFVYYRLRVGMDDATILWTQSYFLAVRAALDLPLGALADRYSRRRCLVAGAAAQATAAAALILFPAVATVWIAETIFAISSALKSGADSAFLFDALKTGNALAHYARAESRGQAVIALSNGGAAVLGGLLAAVDLRLPYLATLVSATAAAVASGLAFGHERLGRGPGETARRLVRDGARLAARTPAVRWVLLLSAFAVTGSHVFYYLQQPYLAAIGVPLAMFGVVVAGVKVVTAGVANAAHRFDDRVGPRGTTTAMVVTSAAGLAGMGVVAGPAGASWLLARGVLDGLWQPLVNVYMNRLVDSRLRATMLSLAGVSARLTLAAGVALLGVGLRHLGLGWTLGVAAAAAVVAGTALVLAAPAVSRLPAQDRVIATGA